MINNITRTTLEHATIIARTVLRTCANRGDSPKITEMRRNLNGRDARAYRMYAAMDDAMTVYDDNDNYRNTMIAPDMAAVMPDPLTDAADLVNVAAVAILDIGRQCPCIMVAINNDTPYVMPAALRREVYRAVNRYIYANAQRPVLRDTYIETLPHNDAGEITDVNYIRATRYYDVDNITDYNAMQSMLTRIRMELTAKQWTVLHKRLQGKNDSTIAAELGVTQQAVNAALQLIRRAVATLYPDATRYLY
mgnify:FL=1|jgi:DNA-binding NarL/FixJ family response regulator